MDLYLRGPLFIALFSFLSLSPLVWAVSDLEAYPNAKLMLSDEAFKADHLLVSGALHKVNGVLRADAEIRHDGLLARQLYLIPTGHSQQQAFAFIEKQLKARNAESIYRCEKRRCGSSNYWANRVFDISKLYGPDNAQAYLLARDAQRPGEYYLAYVIRRGNQRVYLYLEHFTQQAALIDPLQQMQEQFAEQGLVDVQGWPIDPETLSTSQAFEHLLSFISDHEGPWLLMLSMREANLSVSGLAGLNVRASEYALDLKSHLDNSRVASDIVSVRSIGPALRMSNEQGLASGQVVLRLLPLKK